MSDITITNIYEEAKKLGVEVDHHESDLYIPVTPETTELIKQYKSRSNVTTFMEYTLPEKKHCYSCGRKYTIRKPIKQWYDIPFAYQPFWDKVEKATQKI